MAKKTKTLAKVKQETQRVFNTYIRKRDEGKPCISCGEQKPLQAGHYYPVSTYDGLRFNENNVHDECSRCNCFDEGHLINYRPNLIYKIGVTGVMKLEQQAQNYKQNGYKWSRDELLEIKKKYSQLLKELT